MVGDGHLCVVVQPKSALATNCALLLQTNREARVVDHRLGLGVVVIQSSSRGDVVHDPVNVVILYYRLLEPLHPWLVILFPGKEFAVFVLQELQPVTRILDTIASKVLSEIFGLLLDTLRWLRERQTEDTCNKAVAQK